MNVVDSPRIEEQALNELQAPGYIAMAFSSLFPFGSGDYNEVTEMPVTPAEYFKHMFLYHDCSFAQNPRFLHLAMNTVYRWRAE